MSDQILDVDLLAFERGDAGQRRAVVDGVMRSLASGFVYTSHDVSDALLDDAYGKLASFFSLPADVKSRSVAPGTHGQTGYTGLLVETAAVADVPDWKEMLNWGRAVPEGHPLRRKYPHRYHEPVLPDADVPGIGDVLLELHDRLLELQRRFLRIVAVGLGCHESFFDRLLVDGPTLSRAIHYPAMSSAPAAGHVWAGEHADINLVTALPRATERGLQVRAAGGEWVDAAPPAGHAIVNTGMMLERVSNGRVPAGWHRVVADPSFTGDRLSVVQFCHPTPWTVLSPVLSSVDTDHPQRFAPIEAGDLLDQVLYEINLVEDAPRVSGAAP
jgi:isopenicillin N synthase-like dioxygenase